jgi:DNA-binding winged helix-turn-helix (wHTH) protein
MKTWRRAVMELPEDQRLETALFWLEEMTGGADQAVALVKKAFGVPAQVAKLIAALNAASPAVLTKQQLYRVLYPNDDDASIKIVDVQICHARRALPEGAIVTLWGVGYQMPAPLALPDLGLDLGSLALPPEKHRESWTDDDDADLLRMYAAGSDYAAMAEEFDRTARGVQERMIALRRDGKFIGPIRRIGTHDPA